MGGLSHVRNMAEVIKRLRWEFSRFTASRPGQRLLHLLAVFFLLGISFSLAIADRRTNERLKVAPANEQKKQIRTNTPIDRSLGLEHERLRHFESILPPHRDIPERVRQLMEVHQELGLILKQGEYRLEVDEKGLIEKYHIIWPVKGTSESVQRMIVRSLEKEKALALTALQIKQNPQDLGSVEARVHWVLYAIPSKHEFKREAS